VEVNRGDVTTVNVELRPAAGSDIPQGTFTYTLTLADGVECAEASIRLAGATTLAAVALAVPTPSGGQQISMDTGVYEVRGVFTSQNAPEETLTTSDTVYIFSGLNATLSRRIEF